MDEVRIGVDPHQLSSRIEIVDDGATLLGSGRFGTDNAGYQAMLRYTKAWPNRLWAVRAPTALAARSRNDSWLPVSE